jgi:hypothetical protein
VIEHNAARRLAPHSTCPGPTPTRACPGARARTATTFATEARARHRAASWPGASMSHQHSKRPVERLGYGALRSPPATALRGRSARSSHKINSGCALRRRLTRKDRRGAAHAWGARAGPDSDERSSRRGERPRATARSDDCAHRSNAVNRRSPCSSIPTSSRRPGLGSTPWLSAR